MNPISYMLILSIIISTYVQADIVYQQGWNLLGGPVDLSNANNEKLYVYENGAWQLRPKNIKKNQGFWFKADSNGKFKSYDHIFQQKMPASYALYQLVVQYPKLNKEISYKQDQTNNSYMVIHNDLSYEEFLILDINNSYTARASFKGKFMPMVNEENKVVEFDSKTQGYFITTIRLESNNLILIRFEDTDQFGAIYKKYTYLRR